MRTLAGASALFVAVTALRTLVADPAAGVGYLYAVPIAWLAVRFRYVGAASGTAVAIGLVLLSSHWQDEAALGSDAYLFRMAGFASVGVIVAWNVDRSSALKTEADRWFTIVDALCCVADLDGRLTRVNPACERFLGVPERELVGRSLRDFPHPDDRVKTTAEALLLRIESGVTASSETRVRDRHGDWRWLSWSARSDGRHIYATAHDVTDHRRLEDRLLEAAAYDALTGLPNRRAWEQRLAAEAERSARYDDPLAVAMVDVDGLKQVNDAEGHAAGDQLLIRCAAAWLTAIREYDFLARVGGDEFALLMPGCTTTEACEIADRMRVSMPPGSSCSIGIADVGKDTLGAALARADAALYRAKRDGRGRNAVA